MPAQFFGAQAAVAFLNRAFTNTSPSNAAFTNQVTNATAALAAGVDPTQAISYTAFAKTFGNAYAAETAAQLATRLMTNTGLLPNAALETALAEYITAVGVRNIGIVALQLAVVISTKEGDATYGAAALAWNNEMNSAVAYSSNPANTTAFNGDVVATQGQTYTLTTGADAGAAFTGGAGADTFVGTETTLSSADVLDGGAGVDTLRVANSGAAKTFSGFELMNIETIQVTADGTGATAFDVTGTTGVTKLVNSNSSQDLTFTGIKAIPAAGVEVKGVTAGNTTITFEADTVVGTADTLALALDGNKTIANGAVGTITANGIETINVTTSGTMSNLASIASTTLKAMTVAGDKSLTLGGVTFTDNAAVNTLNASGLTGTAALDVTIAANTATLDVAVTGGAGNDRADFSTGFDTLDAFNGGAGRDTLALAQGVASALTATNTGTVTAVEILEITNGGTGTTNMDRFAGVDTVFYSGLTGGTALTGAAAITNAVTGLTVQVNADAAGQDVTTTLKANGTADTISYVLNKVGAADNLATLSAAEFETVNITTGDDAAVLGTGVLTVANLTNTVATKLTIAGNADLVIGNSNDPVTPVLATIDASAATAKVTISGTDLAAGGATVTLGSANDTFNVATAAGADTFDLSKGGNDTIVYNALAQSAVAMDTIKGFTTGDKVDVRALMGGVNVASSANFRGNFDTFSQAQGALRTGADVAATNDAVFDKSTGILWIDLDSNGTLDANDFRVKLDGITTVTAADLGFVSGVTFTANKNAFNTSLTADSVEVVAVGSEADTINATVAQLVGSTINGQPGADTLNVTGTAALAEIADLTGAFTNVETVNLSANVEGVSVDAADLGTTQISKINGAGGVIQSLTVNTGSDLRNTTITNIQTLNQTGTVVMTTTQHNAFGAINAAGGADQIDLYNTTGAAVAVAGNAAIETYRIDEATAGGVINLTVGALAQNITEINAGTQANTYTLGAGAYTGTYTNMEAGDTLVVVNGTNFSGVNAGGAVGMGILNATGTVTLTQTQHQAFTTVNAAGAADTLSVLGAGAVTAAAAIETYSVSSTGANNVTVNAAKTGVNITGAAANATTVTIGGNTVTGTYALGNAADVIIATDGANISGVNAGAATTAENLTLTGTITLTNAQYGGVAAAITALGAADGIIVTDNAALGTVNVALESVRLNGTGADTATFGLADAATLAQSVAVNLIGGGADTITLNNASIDAGLKVINITNFASDDKLVSQVAGVGKSSGIFYNDSTGGIAGLAAGSIVEVNAASYQAGTLTNTAAVLAYLTGAGLTGNGVQATVVVYNGNGTAGIYQINETNAALGAFDTIELIGTVNAANNALVGANFA